MSSNLDSIGGRLAASLSSSSIEDIDNSVDLLTAISRAIRAEKIVLQALASKSYQHENGFAKLTIFDDRKRFRLRLHWWRIPDYSRDRANIHNHRFKCVSHLLRGSLHDVGWKLDSGGAAYTHHCYYPRSGAQKYLLAYAGNAHLSVVHQTEYRSGDTYAMRQDTLHTSHPCKPDTITLFLEDRTCLGRHADVFSQKYPRSDLWLSSPSMKSDSFVDTLSQILDRLSLPDPLPI
jgi:hypothetical protein